MTKNTIGASYHGDSAQSALPTRWDGIIAALPTICDLAEQYDATVMVDDCHATGFLGERGAGTPELTAV